MDKNSTPGPMESVGPSLPLRVDAETAAFLREAYHKIKGQFANHHFGMYDYVRATAGKLAPFDSFYIGLMHGANRLRFPYGWEGGRYDDPASHTYGPNGPTAWLLRHRQTYRFAYDNGASLHAGISFGDVERLSADVVTVPFFRYEGSTRGRIFGMMSMHSYQTGVFDDNTVRAFEWLAGLVARVLTREAEDSEALHALPPGGPVAPETLTSDHVVEYMASRLAEIRVIAREIGRSGQVADGARDGSERIAGICEQAQSELVEMMLRIDEGPERRFTGLSAQEQRVALLLVSGLSNSQLAGELGVSPNTVKTHLKNICRKYGMDNRTQIAEDVRRHLMR
jgi:DNA-binding CsgD family transcriptional regulator